MKNKEKSALPFLIRKSNKITIPIKSISKIITLQ